MAIVALEVPSMTAGIQRAAMHKNIRCPGGVAVAGFAALRSNEMITWFAGRGATVVAGCTGAHHAAMVKVYRRPVVGVVAGIALRGGLNMRR